MIAPFFDDLDDNEGNEPFNVYFWTNNQNSVIDPFNQIWVKKYSNLYGIEIWIKQ